MTFSSLFRSVSARFVAAFLLSLAFHLPTTAVETVPIPATEVRMFQSQIVDQTYKLFVAYPLDTDLLTRDDKSGQIQLKQEHSTQIYPVLYVLDPALYFGTVTEITRQLQGSGDIPPIFVVGIGYPPPLFDGALPLRMRDYFPHTDPDMRAVLNAYASPGNPIKTGGGEAFLEFVRKELTPFINSHYPVNPNDTAVAGHSGGGHIALYTLFHHPTLFQKYVIGSAALSWNKQEAFDWEHRYAENNSDLNARVFMGIGAGETDLRKILVLPPEKRFLVEDYLRKIGDPNPVALNMRFFDKLKSRNFPSLRFTSEVFPGESHESIPPSLFSRGIRYIYHP